MELYKKGYCHPDCIYFPNVSCGENEWTWNEEGTYKIRKEPKIYKCAYDNHPIDWGMCVKESEVYEDGND